MHPHQFITRRSIVAFSLAALMFLTLGFVFAPMKSLAAARQALGSRLHASPTAKKIFSIAPAPIRRVIKKQLVQPEVNKASGVSMAGAATLAPVTITKDAVPPSGSTIAK